MNLFISMTFQIKYVTLREAFYFGANEKYSEKSAALLRQYIPTLRDIVFENMGHGQYLHENSAEYAKGLIEYLAD